MTSDRQRLRALILSRLPADAANELQRAGLVDLVYALIRAIDECPERIRRPSGLVDG
jgi:hypothetical protein